MTTRRRGRFALAICSALALLSAGCGGDDDSGSSSPSATAVEGSSAPSASTSDAGTGSTPASSGSGESTPEGSDEEAVVGGSLTFLEANEIPSFDPFTTTGRASSSGGSSYFAVFGAMATMNGDGSIQPGQAKSMTTDDGGKTWIFELQPGMTFTDGTPFDAEALKWNYEQYAKPESTGAGLSLAKTIESMEVLDPVTVKIVLTAPNGAFDRHIIRNMALIVSPTAYQADPVGFGTNPVGAGPFILKEWVRDDHSTMVRNPDYWDAPRPYVDEITFRPVTDEEQRLNTISAGGADVGIAQRGGVMKRAEDAGLQAGRVFLSSGYYVGFNTRVPPFDDVRMRLAISKVFDTEAFNEIQHEGYGEAVHTLFPKGHVLYNDVQLATYDPAEAQRLIDEYVADHGGEPVKFQGISTNTPVNQNALEFLQVSLAPLNNIEMEIQPLPQAEHIERVLRRQDFQLNIWASQASDPEPTIYGNLHSSFIGTLNITGFADPELDAALDAGRTSDTAARVEAYTRVSEILAEKMPVFYYNRYIASMIAGKNIGNVQKAITEHLMKVDELYVKSD